MTEKKQPKAKLVTVRARFRDGSGNRLSVVRKQRKAGWLTFAESRPKGAASERGMVEVHADEAKAVRAFEALVKQAGADGWAAVETPGVPASRFDALPKPTAAKPKAVEKRTGTKG